MNGRAANECFPQSLADAGRRSLKLLTAVLGLFAPAGAPAEELPYIAYIHTDEVYVRSGPGVNYYPTQQLRRGDEVEVYRHDPGGWLAIRPPEGSFSWVSAEFLQPDEDGLATVVGDRVIVRVGSQLSDVRDVIQVRLSQGEAVELLEPEPTDSRVDGQSWYKISPPSGEFRWIHEKFVSRDSTTSDSEARGETWVERRKPIPVRHELEEATAAGQDPPSRGMRDAENLPDPQGDRPLTREEALARDLDDLELELSTMVVEEPAAWHFDDILDRAKDLLERGETAIERGRARLLIHKIEKFSDIKRRSETIAHLAGTPDSRPKSPGASTPSHLVASPQFDGTGRLARLRSPLPGAPPYALTDASGAIRYFVTPAPGVNLRQYVGQEVGIDGSIGYLPQLDQQNVTARRVQPLGGNLLRR